MLARAVLMQLRAALLTVLVGCAPDAGIEDSIDASFLPDGKSDAFGIEDWSPDGAAVLTLLTTASETTLRDDVGLSQRAVDGILVQRTAIGGTFEDLAQVDAAKWIGPVTFAHLVTYVTEHKLFKTALRVPLVLEGGVPITTYNDLAHANGHPGFAAYTYIDGTVPYNTKASAYEVRLAALEAASGVTIDPYMMRYASSLDAYGATCFVGVGGDVPDLAASEFDGMMGDMYSVWAMRVGTEWWSEDADPAMVYGSAWTQWDTSSPSVLMFTSNNDDGTAGPEIVPPCR
jgi:hypothetical protein